MVKKMPQRAWRNHMYRTGRWGTYNGNCLWVVCRWDGGRIGKWWVECSVNGWDGEELLSKAFPTFPWKNWQKEPYLQLQCAEQRERAYYLSELLDPWLMWIQGWGCRTHQRKKDNLRGTSLPNGEVVAFGRIDRKIPFLRPVNAAVKELWRFMFCVHGATILASSAKSSVRKFA